MAKNGGRKAALRAGEVDANIATLGGDRRSTGADRSLLAEYSANALRSPASKAMRRE